MPKLSNDKQILYFSRLIQLGVNKAVFITLPEIAEIMFTSTRHCRTLLKQMHDLGWLEWAPKVGRNQRSRLYLIYSLNKLKTELAQTLIFQGKYEKALALIDNDQQQFSQLLKNTSGTQRREGRLHVQLTYDRTFSSLLPHTPLRNSERFLLRQIYSCLTQCDEQGNVEPDLAHHWTYDEKTLNWRFYLRPHLRFHDGSDINSAAITELFYQLKPLPLYEKELRHIKAITEINPLCIEFSLLEPDAGFAGLISDVKYSIQPFDQVSNEKSTIGSGIFQVKEHSIQKLSLQAYDDYHGFRALTDTITIWQLPTPYSDVFCDTNLQAIKRLSTDSVCSNYLTVKGGSDNDQQSRIEDGCLLTLVNHRSALSLSQRKYLSQIMSSENLLEQLSKSVDNVEAVTAYNLLPNWSKILPTISQPQPLPDTLTIATFDHHTLKKCSEIISTLLRQIGIDCKTNVYSFENYYCKASNHTLNEDLVLTSMNLDDNRPASAFCWMLSNPVLHQSLSEQDQEWLINKLSDIRSQQQMSCYLYEIESIASALISSHWLIPMFHHKQTLHFEDVLKNVSINVWGWPEIRNVWTDE